MAARPRVALVHDWFVGGGAERVVLELHKMFPEAPIYTSYCSDEWRSRLDGKVITGYLQYWPFSKLRKFIPILRILWFSYLKFDEYDLVISSSGAEAKAIKTGPKTLHINYCHAPTHYYWARYEEYRRKPGLGFWSPAAAFGLGSLIPFLRRWDYRAAQRPDYMIANSGYTQKQIKRYYNRDSVVIHPPVDVERFAGAGSERSGYVVTGRQTPYKRIDLAVAAATKLNLPLTVIGNGPDHSKLVKMAGPSVKFLVGASDKELASQLKRAKGYLFCATDDFGIAAVEALAAGTPVIAYQDGGALDYLKPQFNGLFFKPQSADMLASVIQQFEKLKFDSQAIAKEAEQYAPERFRSEFSAYIKKVRV